MPSITISGVEFLFDECDQGLVESHRWWVSTGYALTKIARPDGSKRTVGMHRLILDDPDSDAIDHINRLRNDNRRCNIRPCSRSENNRNVPARKRKSSKYRGVSWNIRQEKWQVVLRIDGKFKWCGSYETEEEAWAVAKPHFTGIAA